MTKCLTFPISFTSLEHALCHNRRPFGFSQLGFCEELSTNCPKAVVLKVWSQDSWTSLRLFKGP